MATTWTVQPLAVARNKYDAAPLRNDQFVEGSSAAYVKGSPIQKGSNANTVVEYNNSSGLVLGVATIDATSVASAVAYFHEVHEGTICEGNLVNPSSATAIAQTHIGAWYGLTKNSSSAWFLDMTKVSASSAGDIRAVVIGLAGMSMIGDYNPRVEFQFLPAVTEDLGFGT